MKLLFCENCSDVISLHLDEVRTCKCKSIGGKYVDKLNAIYYGGEAVPIGFRNSSLINAIRWQPDSGLGEDFTAFVIAKKCPTFRLVTKEELNLDK